jgi:hypothetical protein
VTERVVNVVKNFSKVDPAKARARALLPCVCRALAARRRVATRNGRCRGRADAAAAARR